MATGKTFVGYDTSLTLISGQTLVWSGNNWVQSDMFINTIEEKTYNELYVMYTGSTLKTGQYYKINDFKTVHFIPETNYAVINTGTTEPLVLLAISSDNFDIRVYSTLYPDDIIYYDITGGDTGDTSFFSGGTFVTGLKGIITYREDTILRNKLYYDYRNVKFRRWKESAGSTFYRSFHSTAHGFQDVYTFKDGSSDIEIGYSKYPNGNHNTRLSNITFDNSQNTLGNIIGEYSFNMYFGSGSTLNSLGNLCYNNIFGNYCYNNKIKDFIIYNTTGDYFMNNTGDIFISGNTIGNNFGYNILERHFSDNITGINIYYNTFGNFTQANIFGDNLTNNNMGNGFISNNISGSCTYNIFGDNCNNLIFLTGCTSNKFVYGLSSINFTGATHVYGNYDCEIFKRSDGSFRLRYTNGSDTILYTNPND